MVQLSQAGDAHIASHKFWDEIKTVSSRETACPKADGGEPPSAQFYKIGDDTTVVFDESSAVTNPSRAPRARLGSPSNFLIT